MFAQSTDTVAGISASAFKITRTADIAKVLGEIRTRYLVEPADEDDGTTYSV